MASETLPFQTSPIWSVWVPWPAVALTCCAKAWFTLAGTGELPFEGDLSTIKFLVFNLYCIAFFGPPTVISIATIWQPNYRLQRRTFYALLGYQIFMLTLWHLPLLIL